MLRWEGEWQRSIQRKGMVMSRPRSRRVSALVAQSSRALSVERPRPHDGQVRFYVLFLSMSSLWVARRYRQEDVSRCIRRKFNAGVIRRKIQCLAWRC